MSRAPDRAARTEAVILLTALQLSTMNAGDEISAAADRLTRSGASMKAPLDDMLDLNRTISTWASR